MNEFLKPTKFKILFTSIIVLFGTILLGMLGITNVGGYGIRGGIYNSLNYLLYHFLMAPYGSCIRISGGGLDISCFLTFAITILVVQIIVYYLIASLIEYRKINFWNSLWIIYFFILLFIFRLGLIPETGTELSAIYYVDLVITLLAAITTLLLATKTKIFNQISWVIFFFFYIIWDVSFNVLIDPYISKTALELSSLIGFVLFVPLYIALYLYAFKLMKSGSGQSR